MSLIWYNIGDNYQKHNEGYNYIIIDKLPESLTGNIFPGALFLSELCEPQHFIEIVVMHR